MVRRSAVWCRIGGALVVLLVLLVAAPLEAQRRGGRISGGSFSRSRGSGSSSFGSGSRSRSRRSSSFGSRSTRSRSSGSRSTARGAGGAISRGSSAGYVPPPTPMTEAAARGLAPRASGRLPFAREVSYAGSPSTPAPGPRMDAFRAPEPRRGGWLAGLAGTGATFLPLAGLVLLLTRRRRTYRKKAKKAPWEVRRISLAFDWTAREAIQRELDAIAASGQAEGGPQALAATGRRVAALLQRHLGSARYALAMREPITRDEAEQVFFERANDLRSRYREEVFEGSRRVVGLPPSTPRPEEGEGLVVVSLIVGAFERDRAPVEHTRAALGHALERWIPPSAHDLGPLEIVWSPAETGDRMSSLELEALYPELLPLDEGRSALGRRDCRFCGAPFAAELNACPACGAPEELT